MENVVLSRRDFIKKMTCGLVGVLALAKFGTTPVMANTVTEVKDEGNIVQSAVAPNDHSKMWLNNGTDENTYGVDGEDVPAGTLCYWDDAGGGWRPTTTTWA